MNGNVWEWCSDWYAAYPAETLINPVGPTTGRSRVLRGGSWNDFARSLRSAWRYAYRPGCCYRYEGFRLAGGRPSGA